MKSIRDEANKAIKKLETRYHIESLIYQLPKDVMSEEAKVDDDKAIEFNLKFTAVPKSE